MGPGKSDLFQQKDTKTAAPNLPSLEKKDSVAPATSQLAPTENKVANGLFQNLANREEKKDVAPIQPVQPSQPIQPAQTAQTVQITQTAQIAQTTAATAAPQKPLILGSAGLFGDDFNVPVPENPILVARSQSIIPGSAEEPQLIKKDSLFQVMN